MSKAMDERQTRALERIERARHAIRRMRGKYRVNIAPANLAPVAACKAIGDLWSVLGLTDAAPVLHGDPMVRDLKAFRAECFVALELLDDIEAAVSARDIQVAGLLLSPLFVRINLMWRCCVGMKAEQARAAAAARTDRLPRNRCPPQRRRARCAEPSTRPA